MRLTPSALALALLAPAALAAPPFETDIEKRGYPARCPAGQTAQSKGIAPTPNGCTAVPDGVFKGCCNTHDSCYADCGRTKRQCDDAFLVCMRAACEEHYGAWWKALIKASCRAGAETYHAGVAVGGDIFFLSATKKHCTCV